MILSCSLMQGMDVNPVNGVLQQIFILYLNVSWSEVCLELCVAVVIWPPPLQPLPKHYTVD